MECECEFVSISPSAEAKHLKRCSVLCKWQYLKELYVACLQLKLIHCDLCA